MNWGKNSDKNEYPDWHIFIRDKCRCQYCGFDGKNDFGRWRHLEVDHLIPKAKGGGDSDENKVTSCQRCNTIKGSYDPRNEAMNKSKEELIMAARKYIIEIIAHEHLAFVQMMDDISKSGG